MNGQQNLVLPFSVNPVEVEENKEAVLNGLSAIQRFFEGYIWSPLSVNIYFLFAKGVEGETGHLCDWVALPKSWFAFEQEIWEEEEYLWYFSFFYHL